MWINFLGVHNFDFEIIEECSTNEEMQKKEQFYINYYNSIEDGYNKQIGGKNNSIGSGNGRALLTDEDVIEIRTAYKNHKSQKDSYEKYKDKISFNQFQSVWQGRNWTHIMPEVYTEENKKYYQTTNRKQNQLTPEELYDYRKYYINHTGKETYQKLLLDKGPILKENTFLKILFGDVKKNSLYSTVPVYKKKEKEWIKIDNKPVSTIPETGK